MLSSDSFVERSASVSSMRRISVPSLPRASSQLKSAVRALPTCNWPVGLGAKRNLIVLKPGLRPGPRLGRSRGPPPPASLPRDPAARGADYVDSYCSPTSPQQGDGMRGDCLSTSDGIDALVRLPLDAHGGHGHPNRI